MLIGKKLRHRKDKCKLNYCLIIINLYVKFKGSYIEVYSGIEFPKHDFQFNYDTNCRIYVVILPHSGLSYNMF